MNKAQAQSEYLKILKKKIKAEDKIMKEAKENGTWKSGLDSNNYLFEGINKEFNEKLELLKQMVDD